MRRNYFVINGTQHFTGTIFIVKHMGKEKKASFVYYDTDSNKYVYQIDDCKYYASEANFNNAFIRIIGTIDNNVYIPTLVTEKDFEIDGMFIGWIWYIFLMLVSFIFKDAIGLWILISIIFFSWRYTKKQK